MWGTVAVRSLHLGCRLLLLGRGPQGQRSYEYLAGKQDWSTQRYVQHF